MTLPLLVTFHLKVRSPHPWHDKPLRIILEIEIMIILFDFLSLEKWIKGLKPNLATSSCLLVTLVLKARVTASWLC